MSFIKGLFCNNLFMGDYNIFDKVHIKKNNEAYFIFKAFPRTSSSLLQLKKISGVWYDNCNNDMIVRASSLRELLEKCYLIENIINIKTDFYPAKYFTNKQLYDKISTLYLMNMDKKKIHERKLEYPIWDNEITKHRAFYGTAPQYTSRNKEDHIDILIAKSLW